MIDALCRRINQKMIEKNIIEFADHDIYMYGLQLFISTLFKFIGLSAIAYGLGWIKEVSVFIIAFSTLRVNAGGYHSNTYFRCFILTTIIMISSIILAKYITIYNSIFIIISMLVIAILMVLKYAPVDTPNKPLNANEYKIYRKRSIVIVILESLITILTYLLKKDLLIYCNIATMAILIESLTLVPFVSNSTDNKKRI